MPIQTLSEPKAEPTATCSIDRLSFTNKASCTSMPEMAHHSRPELDSDGKKAPEMAQHRPLLVSGQQDIIPHKK